MKPDTLHYSCSIAHSFAAIVFCLVHHAVEENILPWVVLALVLALLHAIRGRWVECAIFRASPER